MKKVSTDCVDLSAACMVLAKSRKVQALVKECVGPKVFAAALKLMKSGNLDGDLGADVDALLDDAIENHATVVWSGFIRRPDDDYPVEVYEYNGVYWVSAQEYDRVGYFLALDAAESFVRSNWDNVYEDGEEPEVEDEETCCPYCGTAENCDHLLLMVDLTFRSADGGLIYDAFNAKWSDLSAERADDEDFDEGEVFDELLEQVESLADSQTRSSLDSSPGMSSTYAYFFCSSKKRTQTAAKKFSGV